MFGYATDETEECMPLTLVLAHQMNKKISDLRRDGTLWWARPDTKTQVTAEYVFDKGACVPIRVHTVVVSCQHSEKVTLEALRKDIMEKVVYTTIPKKYLDADTKFHINPCGNFVIGGPMGDAGLTGRKIIVDTYGGWGAHGGGAFSGKDYTKVDRSAAYAARWVAKSLVKAGLCKRCLVQVRTKPCSCYACFIDFLVFCLMDFYTCFIDIYSSRFLMLLVLLSLCPSQSSITELAPNLLKS